MCIVYEISPSRNIITVFFNAMLFFLSLNLHNYDLNYYYDVQRMWIFHEILCFDKWLYMLFLSSSA